MKKELKYSTARTVYAARESVWNFLQSAEFYKMAWDSKLITTWAVNTPVVFTGTWEGVEYTDKGIVIGWQEGKLLEFTYWSSFWNAVDVPDEYCKVCYSLNQLDAYSCELIIEQSGFRDNKHYADTVELWNSTIEIAKFESEKIDLRRINHKNFTKLITVLDSIQANDYNEPRENGWKKSQLIEHIILGNSGLKQFLSEVSLPLSRSYDANIGSIRKLLTNMQDKLQSPDEITPQAKNYDLEQHKLAILAIHTEINDCLLTLDLKQKCGAFEMPSFGFMSNFEWLNFSVFHIMRHTNQLLAF